MKRDIVYEIALWTLTTITLYGFVVLLAPSCTQPPVQTDNVSAAKSKCYDKRRSSRPTCWKEADWKVLCERVQCKPIQAQE